MRIVNVILLVLGLSACDQPVAQQPPEANVTLGETRLNKSADQDVSKWEAYERANDAKIRFRVAEEQARIKRSRAPSKER
jgi:hypothetical protein